MRTLSKNQWIAVTVVVLVAAYFMGARFFTNFSSNPSTISDQAINNNMDQNTQNTKNNLVVKDIVVGTGAEAQAGDLVSVHYTGKFANGTTFDSSIGGQPFEFTLGAGRVIKGWDQGVVGMKVGGKRTLTIPPELAYGPNDYQQIPGGSTLYFDIELIGVKKQ